MSWSTEGVAALRAMTGDAESPYEFSDSRLTQLVCLSLWQVYQQVRDRLPRAYQIDVVNLDVTPDPAGTSLSDPDRDEAFLHLAFLKAACTLQKGAARQAAGGAFALRDRDLSVDTRAKSAGLLALLKEGVSFCSEYEGALRLYQTAESGSAAAAVLGPYRYCLAAGTRRRPDGFGRRYF